MLRSILLGLLALGIVPIALADATATSDTKIIANRKVTARAHKKSNLVAACVAVERSPNCLSDTNSDNFQIHSELWLNNIANVLLSGSMFQGCRNRLKPTNNSTIQGLQRSPRRLASAKCIFSWQQPINNQQSSEAIAVLPELSNGISSDSLDRLTASTILEDNNFQFPTRSRTSLIVSLPTADSTFAPINTKLANPAPDTKRIASPFGWRTRPYSYQLQFHQGIDYGAPLGSPVVAVGDGIVTKVVSGCYDFGNLFCGGQLGNWIEIDHGNGRLGVYGHLKNNSIAIEEGAKVWKNQEIAQVGSSGWSTGAHLDFRFKVNGEYEDPAKYLTPPDSVDI